MKARYVLFRKPNRKAWYFYYYDGDSDALNRADRLEPHCKPGGVLVSKELYWRLVTSDRFVFEETIVTPEKGAAGMPAGVPTTAYYVEEKPKTEE